MDTVEALQSPLLSDFPHGFLGRRGGVSTGIFEGLDLGRRAQGTNEHIDENRRRAIAAVLPNASLSTLYQIHSADVVTVAAPLGDNRPQADAMVTDHPNILLGILTADCVPVLFADSEAGVVGAAHAGWKGAIGGVTDSTIAAMEALGAVRARISCAVGPCIAQKSYEVDDGFFRRFAEADPENERFFLAGKPDHYQFDLEGYVAARLAAAGIAKVECLGEDTYSQEDRFYSYRRSCHRGEPDYGRQISLIGINA
jgi:YfiH family protein